MTRRVTADIHRLPPRGLSREEAAHYLGLAPAGFDDWVARGLIPGPIPGTRRWDRKAIDLALDRLSNIAPNSPADEDAEAYYRSKAKNARQVAVR